jgi:hypothetical protein
MLIALPMGETPGLCTGSAPPTPFNQPPLFDGPGRAPGEPREPTFKIHTRESRAASRAESSTTSKHISPISRLYHSVMPATYQMLSRSRSL